MSKPDLERIYRAAIAACPRSSDHSFRVSDLKRELMKRLDGVDDADKGRKAQLIIAAACRSPPSIVDALNVDAVGRYIEQLEEHLRFPDGDGPSLEGLIDTAGDDVDEVSARLDKRFQVCRDAGDREGGERVVQIRMLFVKHLQAETARSRVESEHLDRWAQRERAKGRPEDELTLGNCLRETGVLVTINGTTVIDWERFKLK